MNPLIGTFGFITGEDRTLRAFEPRHGAIQSLKISDRQSALRQIASQAAASRYRSLKLSFDCLQTAYSRHHLRIFP